MPESVKEVWMPVCNYEYEASNTGRICSVKFNKRKILVQRKPGKYLQVDLYKCGKPKTLLVHRLVAEAFVPNPNNLPEVNHKNGIKTDNSVENLEWVTTERNNEHAFEVKLQTPKLPVIAIKLDGSITRFQSIHEAERKTGINNGNISRCCNGLINTAGGYFWKFDNN